MTEILCNGTGNIYTYIKIYKVIIYLDPRQLDTKFQNILNIIMNIKYLKIFKLIKFYYKIS